MIGLGAGLDCSFPQRRAVVLATATCETLAERVTRRLTETLPRVRLAHQPLTKAYYDGLRVMFGADTSAGVWSANANLSRFDWVAQLTSNRRQRFIASGSAL